MTLMMRMNSIRGPRPQSYITHVTKGLVDLVGFELVYNEPNEDNKDVSSSVMGNIVVRLLPKLIDDPVTDNKEYLVSIYNDVEVCRITASDISLNIYAMTRLNNLTKDVKHYALTLAPRSRVENFLTLKYLDKGFKERLIQAGEDLIGGKLKVAPSLDPFKHFNNHLVEDKLTKEIKASLSNATTLSLKDK